MAVSLQLNAKFLRRLILSAVTFILVVSEASALTQPRVAFSAQVPGLDSAQYIDVLQSVQGQVSGYVLSFTNAKKIVVLDEAGITVREIDLDYSPTEVIHRYSADYDTLAIYTDYPPEYVQTGGFYDYARIGLAEISLVDDSVIKKEVWRSTSLYAYDFCSLSGELGSALHFRTLPDGGRTIISGFSLHYDCYLMTNGPYWGTWVDASEYALDLSGPLGEWYATDVLAGNFSTSPVTTFCGYRSVSDGYHYYSGWTPPYVDNTGTYLWIPGWSDPTNSWSFSDHTYVSRIFAGRFDPNDPYDEVVLQGTGQDWVGKHPWASQFMAAYSLGSGVVTEKWYASTGGRDFSEIYPAESCLVGMSGPGAIAVMKYRNGQITTPLPLGRSLAATKFILPEVSDAKLRLVGRAADTLFLYEFDQLVDVPESNQPLPESFELSQNYPNPFNPSTTISYNLPRRSDVTIEIFNLLGQRVRTLVDESQSSGPHQVEWDGTDETGSPVSSGVYLYRLKAGESVQSKKMMLLK